LDIGVDLLEQAKQTPNIIYALHPTDSGKVGKKKTMPHACCALERNPILSENKG